MQRILVKLQGLVDRLIPSFDLSTHHEEFLSYRYYQFLCVVNALIFLGFSVNSLKNGFYELGIAQASILIAVGISIVVYRKTKSITLASNLILLFMSPLTFYRSYILGGLAAPMIFAFPVASVLSLMTVPLGWAFFWTAVHLGFGGYFYSLSLQGIDSPVLATPAMVSTGRIATIIAVEVILLFSVYLIRKLNSNLRAKLQEENKDVINVVRALSHDLSSPMMTLSFWLKEFRKKNPTSDFPSERYLDVLSQCKAKIDEVRQEQARRAGKTGESVLKEEDPEKQLTDKIFKFVIIGLVVTFGFFGFHYLFVMGQTKIGLLQLGVSAVSAVGAIVFYRTGSVTIPGNMVFILGSTSAFFRAKMLGGISSPAFLIWPIIPILAGVVLSVKQTAFWTGVYICIALFYFVTDLMGVVYPSAITPEAADKVRIVALCIVQLVVFTTVYYMKKQNTNFRILLESKKKSHIDLLKLLTLEIGQPLKKMQEEPEVSQENVAQIKRSLQSCLDVIRFGEGWVQSAEKAINDKIDLREIVSEVSFLQDSAIKAKNINWDIKLEQGRAPVVNGDRICFSFQILNNLVSNAIKFTPEGGHISIKVVPSQDRCVLVVEDDGIGIPEEILKDLFDSGKPTTRNGTTGEKGTGFGMPIVKMFVEKYNGTIDVESKCIDSHPDDHGTKIKISLPMAA